MAGVAAALDRIKDLYQKIRLGSSYFRLLSMNDSGDLQTMQVEGFIGELRGNADRMGEWGLASNPPLNSQLLGIALGGNRGRIVVLGVEDRATRPRDLEAGEVVLYTIAGRSISLKPDGSVEIEGTSIDSAASAANDLSGATVSIDATGTVTITGASVSINGIDFSAHTHTTPAGQSGPPQ